MIMGLGKRSEKHNGKEQSLRSNAGMEIGIVHIQYTYIYKLDTIHIFVMYICIDTI